VRTTFFTAKKALCLMLPVGLALVCAPVSAQIFGGVTGSGAVLLSNLEGGDAQTVVVAAPVAELVATVGNPPIVAKTTGAEALKPAGLAQPPKEFHAFIQEASRASRLPAGLIHAVISVESNYNPNALSPKGAQGLMQLMPATAKRFGGGNAPLDPRQNILTGSRYLRWLMDHFNQNMELAVAAYNAGEAAVVKAGYRIPPYAETLNYVPKVLARFERAVKV
jgi:soluble lytic murein transglycosylase-like protein